MILQSNEQLEHLIVKLLAQKPNLTAGEIQKRIEKKENAAYSIQGIYKELRKLQNEGVAVKVKNRFSLRIPWALDFMALADIMSQTYLNPQALLYLLPEKGRKFRWKFTSLLRTNDFWSQILLVMFQKSSTKKLFGSQMHPWWHLAQPQLEAQYVKSVGRVGGTLYIIIYGRTHLDRLAEPFWKEHVVYSFGHNPFNLPLNVYITMMDDYIVTITIDSETARRMEALYNGAKRADVFDFEEVMRFFNHKAKAVCQIENNPKKAAIWRKKFSRFFGEKF